MFSNLLFIILILLMLSFAPLGNGNDWVASPSQAFFLGFGLYLLLLGAIALQNQLLRKNLKRFKHLLLIGINCAYLSYLTFFLFFLAGQRMFPTSTLFVSLFSLLQYFFALYIFHITAYHHLAAGSRGAVRSASDYALLKIRFLLPFTLPFLLFSSFFDLFALIPEPFLPTGLPGALLMSGAAVLTLLFIILFFPPLIVKIWKCKDIKDPALLSRLKGICKRANFTHAGMKFWTVMNDSYTAGIIGVLPNFRYVMFTRRLIDEISKEAIEAILAHEIGHSKHKHLIHYPFIIFGMVILTSFYPLIFGEAINVYFTLQDTLHPSPIWKALYPLAFFIPYAALALVYFRLVFGHFSRLFERQADLHVYDLGVPPEYMIQALDQLGHMTGKTHAHPNWHHHSINDRIQFLEQTIEDNSLIAKHHRSVKRQLLIYFGLLIFLTGVTISPFLADIFPFNIASEIVENISRSFADSFAKQVLK